MVKVFQVSVTADRDPDDTRKVCSLSQAGLFLLLGEEKLPFTVLSPSAAVAHSLVIDEGEVG